MSRDCAWQAAGDPAFALEGPAGDLPGREERFGELAVV
jgi:hypothetical protein